MKLNPYTKRPYGTEERPTAARPPDAYVYCAEARGLLLGIYLDDRLTLRQARRGVCPDCKGNSVRYRRDTCDRCHNTGKIK